jgi:hypothetical protein
MILEGYKFIECLPTEASQERRQWLFHLDADPLEQHDLSALMPERLQQMRAELDQAFEHFRKAGFEISEGGSAPVLTPDVLQALQQLGYVEEDQD